jgi:hypothetical protein
MLKYLEKHKAKVGVVVVFVAGGLRGLGYPEAEHVILYVAALLGYGYTKK